jgi:hypothetical protein
MKVRTAKLRGRLFIAGFLANGGGLGGKRA